jgi:anti-sigma B factor antagonist
MAERVSRGAEREPPGYTPARPRHHSHGLRRFPRRRLTEAGRRFRVATTEQLDTGAAVVSVMGEVERATVLALEQTLLGVTEDRTGDVIVDLTCCSFLDSRALGALNAARARLERSGRRLTLVLANQSVLRIFQITRFDELFEIYPSLRAAVDRSGNGERAPAHLAPAGASR